MTTNAILVRGTEVVLEANGGSTATTVFTQANDTNLTAANMAGYPYLQVEFSGTFASAPAAGGFVDVYLRPINFESTNDNPVPSATFTNNYLCSIPIVDSASAQYIQMPGYPQHPNPLEDCEVYICNRASVTLNAGWTLKVQPVCQQLV